MRGLPHCSPRAGLQRGGEGRGGCRDPSQAWGEEWVSIGTQAASPGLPQPPALGPSDAGWARASPGRWHSTMVWPGFWGQTVMSSRPGSGPSLALDPGRAFSP